MCIFFLLENSTKFMSISKYYSIFDIIVSIIVLALYLSFWLSFLGKQNATKSGP